MKYKDEMTEEQKNHHNHQIQEAMDLIEEAMTLIDATIKGTEDYPHYEAYGKYGFNQLLGNGNPHDNSLHDLMNDPNNEYGEG